MSYTGLLYIHVQRHTSCDCHMTSTGGAYTYMYTYMYIMYSSIIHVHDMSNVHPVTSHDYHMTITNLYSSTSLVLSLLELCLPLDQAMKSLLNSTLWLSNWTIY